MNANIDLKWVLTLPEAVDAIQEVLPRVLAGMDTSNPKEAASFILDELQFCINMLKAAMSVEDGHV